MKKIIITFIVSFGMYVSASAQNIESMFNIAWDINVPIGNTFVETTSGWGGKVEFRKFVHDKISVGLEVNWASLYDYKPRETYQIEKGAITSDAFKYLYILPLNLNAHYYIETGGLVIPYAGLGMGATYSQQDVFVSAYDISSDNWGFLVRPEIGAIIQFSQRSQVGLLLGARYNYMSNQENDFNMKGIQTISFQIGLAFLR